MRALFTVIRDKRTGQADFVRHSDRLLHILAEETLARLPTTHTTTVETPCGPYEGLAVPSQDRLAVVSIVRAGA